MSRLRGENLRSIYILLFLNVAFFFLQIENPEHYVNFFAFDRTHVFVNHEWWRLLTYQFIHGDHTLFFFPPPVALFFNLILLHVFNKAMEEVIGTRHFLTIFGISVLGTAGVASLLNVPLLGTFFLSYTLIFIAATM